jgi:hypothetical protein
VPFIGQLGNARPLSEGQRNLRDNGRVPYKLAFYEAFFEHAKSFDG